MSDESVAPREPEDDLGAIRPSPEVRAEIVEFLRNDQSRVGEVFRGRERGLSADAIAAELDVATSGGSFRTTRSTSVVLLTGTLRRHPRSPYRLHGFSAGSLRTTIGRPRPIGTSNETLPSWSVVRVTRQPGQQKSSRRKRKRNGRSRKMRLGFTSTHCLTTCGTPMRRVAEP